MGDRFPRSMPPPAPPRVRQDPLERARLERYRHEVDAETLPYRLARLKRLNACRRYGLDLALASYGQERALRKALREKYAELRAEKRRERAPLYQLLAACPGGPCDQVEVARRVGITKMGVNFILRGLREPGFALGLRLARALGIKARELADYLARVQSSPYV